MRTSAWVFLLVGVMACGDDDTGGGVDSGTMAVCGTVDGMCPAGCTAAVDSDCVAAGCNNLMDSICQTGCETTDPDCSQCTNLADGLCAPGCEATDPDCATACNNLADAICPPGCPTDPDCTTMMDAGVGMDTGVGGGTDAGSCLERATSPSEMCACNMCITELETCEADPGCVAIRECARTSGCRGIDCYGLLSPGPCRDVIDSNGGVVGQSGMNASALSDCVTMRCEGG